MQQQEIFAASQNGTVAAAAAALTFRRLRRYMGFHLQKLDWLPQTAIVALQAASAKRPPPSSAASVYSAGSPPVSVRRSAIGGRHTTPHLAIRRELEQALLTLTTRVLLQHRGSSGGTAAAR
ncbi:MAG: hypothetical protein RL685_1003 [Pseudomonadota bacterium]